MQKRMNNKGFTGIVAIVIAVVLGVILVGAVAFPIVRTTINATSLGLTGADASIANLLPTLVLVSLLVLIAGVAIMGFMRGGGK